METCPISAVLFAKDHRRVAAFYMDVFDATVAVQDDHHTSLEIAGFRLVVQQIPTQMARQIHIEDPPKRREHGAVRLTFPVRDVGKRRARAKKLGGQIDEQPPKWAEHGSTFYLGADPEGNVVGCDAC